jgi:hypothetical protein
VGGEGNEGGESEKSESFPETRGWIYVRHAGNGGSAAGPSNSSNPDEKINQGTEPGRGKHEEEPEHLFQRVGFTGKAVAKHLEPKDDAEDEADDFEVAGIFKKVGQGEGEHESAELRGFVRFDLVEKNK